MTLVSVDSMARWIECKVGNFPLTYLGLTIGIDIREECDWKPIVDKFKKRLSSWKASRMSFGG